MSFDTHWDRILLHIPASPDERTAAVGLMQALCEHARLHGNAHPPLCSPDHRLVTGCGLPAVDRAVFDISALHAAGFSVVPYTVNEPTHMRALITAGVSGLITDRPDLLLPMATHHAAAHFDVQGHRGARGLRPENTLPAMEAALDLGVSTLETDAVITRDDVAVLSHSPYLQATVCRPLEDAPYAERDTVLIRDLDFAELQSRYICDRCDRDGLQHNNPALSPVSVAYTLHRWLPHPYVMPSLGQLFDFVVFYRHHYAAGSGRAHPDARRRAHTATHVRFNVETKLNPRREQDGRGYRYCDRTPAADCFLAVVLDTIFQYALVGRVMLQSFDLRTLFLAHRECPTLRTVALFGDEPLNRHPTSPDAGDGTNLQPDASGTSPWLVGFPWPYTQI